MGGGNLSTKQPARDFRPLTAASRISFPIQVQCYLCADQGYGVGAEAGVGVARSRGNEQVVGVGVDQTASTPTPERFV